MLYIEQKSFEEKKLESIWRSAKRRHKEDFGGRKFLILDIFGKREA
jgi:hypothetical protein